MTARPPWRPPAARSERGRHAWVRGLWAETLCSLSLWLRGYRVLQHRRRGGRGSGCGELDMVACRGRVLAFIEVKARPNLHQASIALQPDQCQRLNRAAQAFVATHPQLAAGRDVRFDVMLVGARRWPKHVIDAWRDEH